MKHEHEWLRWILEAAVVILIVLAIVIYTQTRHRPPPLEKGVAYEYNPWNATLVGVESPIEDGCIVLGDTNTVEFTLQIGYSDLYASDTKYSFASVTVTVTPIGAPPRTKSDSLVYDSGLIPNFLDEIYHQTYEYAGAAQHISFQVSDEDLPLSGLALLRVYTSEEEYEADQANPDHDYRGGSASFYVARDAEDGLVVCSQAYFQRFVHSNTRKGDEN